VIPSAHVARPSEACQSADVSRRDKGRSRLRTALRALALLAGTYAAVCAVAWIGQRALLFPAPRETRVRPPLGSELLDLVAKDGAAVHALSFPAPPGAPTVVHLHGNGETMTSSVKLAETLRAEGVGVVLVEYRGYGISGGSPSESGLYADAEAVLDHLAADGTGPARVVLYGASLGSGVAAEMAARGRCAALVLVSPFTSIAAVARRMLPLLPTEHLVRDRFDTLGKAARIHVPTLVVHGDHDGVIPFAMGEAVTKAIAGATLLVVPGAGHDDLLARDGDRIVRAVVALAAQHAKPVAEEAR
jgi:pimeloyl-ACP methyl ester carboxylesterase